MVLLKIVYLSIWSYKGHVRCLRESKSYLFYIHVTSKNEIHICSNKHETDRGDNGYISQEKILSYSELQGIWALVHNKGCSQK